MKSIHFRVSDQVYDFISKEAEELGEPLAQFARIATIGRTILAGKRRGMSWADYEEWEPIFELIDVMSRHDEAKDRKAKPETG